MSSGHLSAYAIINLNPGGYVAPGGALVEADVRSWAVLTEEDLNAYVATALREDQRLDGISFESDHVEVRYKEEGKFLALVPITFIVRAVARASGLVEFHYPWYAFLTVDRVEMLKTELKVALDTARRARSVGSVRAVGEPRHPYFTASESAEVASSMHAILKSELVLPISE